MEQSALVAQRLWLLQNIKTSESNSCHLFPGLTNVTRFIFGLLVTVGTSIASAILNRMEERQAAAASGLVCHVTDSALSKFRHSPFLAQRFGLYPLFQIMPFCKDPITWYYARYIT